jgi:uncharacterized protein (TIGR02996 family)
MDKKILTALRSGDCWQWATAREASESVVLKSVDLSEAKLADFDLSAVDLSNADLCEADLTGSSLDSASLDGADLSEATLVEIEVTSASFVGAALDGARVSGRFSACDFRETTWSGALVESTSFNNCVFEGAEIVSEAFFSRNTFNGCHLAGITGISDSFLADLIEKNPPSSPEEEAGLGTSIEDVEPCLENADLEKPLLANPDDEAAYVAYGDWLREQGDPRGELIKVQHQLITDDDADLWEEEEELLDMHAERLIGPRLALYSGPFKAEWHLGYLRSVSLGLDEDSWDDGLVLNDLLGGLLNHSSAHFLQHLTLGWSPTADDFDEIDYQPVVDLLMDRKPSNTLRSLFVGDCWPEAEISWIRLGDISKLYPTFPKLRRLELLGNDLTLGAMSLPNLCRLGLYSGELQVKNIESLEAASLPQLEHLELWLGNAKREEVMPSLRRLLSPKHLPALKVLALANCSFADALCDELAELSILPQLEELDLSMGTLTDRGVATLTDQRDAFSHLQSLDLQENFLSDQGASDAATLCSDVRAGDQREPEQVGKELSLSVVAE